MKLVYLNDRGKHEGGISAMKAVKWKPENSYFTLVFHSMAQILHELQN